MKIKRVRISNQTFANLFRTGKENHFRVCDGLPDDAEIINSAYDPMTHCLFLIVRSEYFENVAECSVIPELFVTLETICPAKGDEA